MKPKFWNKGKLYLSNKDKVLKSIISIYPNEYLSINENYFHCLLNSIIGQQISVSAASAIKKRFFLLNKNINPTNILEIKNQSFKKVGLSKQKILYIKNIAIFFIENKNFMNSAPANVIENEKKKLQDMTAEFELIKANLEMLQ